MFVQPSCFSFLSFSRYDLVWHVRLKPCFPSAHCYKYYMALRHWSTFGAKLPRASSLAFARLIHEGLVQDILLVMLLIVLAAGFSFQVMCRCDVLLLVVGEWPGIVAEDECSMCLCRDEDEESERVRNCSSVRERSERGEERKRKRKESGRSVTTTLQALLLKAVGRAVCE